MSLFGSLQIANSSLHAAQIGLQVTGNNIANANTPGYIRQRAVLIPGPTQLVGELPLGLGVRVDGIIQQSDRFLSDRLRGALSDLSNSETQENTYTQLEALIGELTETDLSTSLTSFFSAVNDILNQPEDLALRNLAVLQGKTVTDEIGLLDQRVRALHSDVNQQIAGMADDVNRLLEEIAELNVNTIVTEGGTTSGSEAVGLRDQRESALTELSELIGVRVVEQENGSVTVFAGGEYLVFEGGYRPVTVSYSSDRAIAAAAIHIEDTDSPVTVTTGKLAGLYAARDEILGEFIDELDGFAQTLMFEFNKVHSGGQGLTGFSELTGEFGVDDVDLALDQAGLQHAPINGSFQVLVKNTRSNTVETSDIFVKLNGLSDDTSLNDLVASLDAVDGISAELTLDQQLRVYSDASENEFAFAHDTSGALAALGLNIFFTGTAASDLGVSSVLSEDVSKFAASRAGIGVDSDNAVSLAGFDSLPLDSRNGDSLTETYESMVAGVAQASSVTGAVSEGFRVFHRTLEGQYLGLTGVSVDDEAIQMITYQRVFQAAARFISTTSELLETLVNL